MPNRPLLYSTETYGYLADALAQHGQFDRGTIERKGFPDGERYHRLETRCGERDIVLVGGTVTDADTLELYDLACGAVYYGARRLTLVLPYFGYSTMERATQAGEVVKAKGRARLLSSIPAAAFGNRVFLVDLHAAGIAHYFEGGIHPTHVYAESVISQVAARLGGDSFVLGSTDAGRAKWVESLASALAVDVAFVYKRRVSGEQTEVTGVSAHVSGRSVVIYDDMVRTGSSLLGAARAYRDAGATGVSAVTTHGLFPGDALDRIRASGLIDSLVATDSHPRAVELQDDYLQIESIAPLLAAELEGPA